ncbi:MAG TPA: hypothetical protein VK473_05800 [Terriglobales bacterium]|nr:hypothetical protein [Terriglobales bacterium]
MSTRALLSSARETIRNLTPKQKLYLGLSGAVGGTLASLADLIQKEHASAVLEIDRMLRTVLNIPSHPIIVVGLLVGFAIALCFIFAADTNVKAFYSGASVLSIIMAMVPFKAPPNLDTSPTQPPTLSPAPVGWLEQHLALPVVYAQAPARALPQFKVDVHLSTQDRKPVSDAVYTLLDPATGEVIARSRTQGSDYTFYVTSRDYLLRVEVTGYTIAERRLSPRSPQSLTITLSPTKVPLALQRVWKP